MSQCFVNYIALLVKLIGLHITNTCSTTAKPALHKAIPHGGMRSEGPGYMGMGDGTVWGVRGRVIWVWETGMVCGVRDWVIWVWETGKDGGYYGKGKGGGGRRKIYTGMGWGGEGLL